MKKTFPSPEPEVMTLRELREQAGVTQVKLAEKLGMTQASVSRIETRQDHLTSTIRQYVKALGGNVEFEITIGERKIKL